jgi:MFS family permease
VLTPYRRILAVPGAAAFSAVGLLARMPNSMNSLGIVLLVSVTSGSYGLAGLVAGAYTLAGAVGGPLIGRLSDRYGQHRVLPPTIVVNAVGLGAVILAARLHAPSWALLAAAVFGGAAMPAIGSMVRARWAAVLRGDPRLQTAFALEAIVDELVYIVGPVLVTALDASVAGSGLGTAIAFAVLGGGTLATLRSSEPPPRPGWPAGHRRRPAAVLWTVVVGAAFLGAVFASLDVSVVAAADGFGRRAAAGPVLAALAAGSLVAATLYGMVRWRRPPEVRLGISLCGLTLVLPGLGLAPSLPWLAVAAFVGGLGIAPSLTAAMSLTERLVPAGGLTEGIALVTSGVALGLTGGAVVSGHVVDLAGPAAGFAVAILAGASAAALALVSRARLARAVADRNSAEAALAGRSSAAGSAGLSAGAPSTAP